jgi:hypothetical protein
LGISLSPLRFNVEFERKGWHFKLLKDGNFKLTFFKVSGYDCNSDNILEVVSVVFPFTFEKFFKMFPFPHQIFVSILFYTLLVFDDLVFG